MQEWPDILHEALLRHLGGPRHVRGYLWPYANLCRSCLAATHAPNLWRHVDLSEDSDATRERVLATLRRCRNVVRRLSLHGLAEVDDDVVASLVHLFADGQLVALDIGGCPNVSGAALRSLASISTLEELGLKYVASLEDEHLAALCSGCPMLTRLDVRFCERLADISVVSQRRSWEALQLDGCFRLDTSELLLQRSLPCLVELSLDGEDLNAQQLGSVASVFPGLRRLTVSFAQELDATSLGALAGLGELDALSLRKANAPSDEDWANFFRAQRAARQRHAAEGAREVEAAAPWRELVIDDCEHFADMAAAELSAGMLPRLVAIDLSWCWHLSDGGLAALLATAPSLERIKLAGIKNVTSQGLAPCIRMARLRELDCTACNCIADCMLEFLYRLFAGPPGTCEESLPTLLPPLVGEEVAKLWARRSRAWPELRVKNYYGEYLQDWAHLRPSSNICNFAEGLLAEKSVTTP